MAQLAINGEPKAAGTLALERQAAPEFLVTGLEHIGGRSALPPDHWITRRGFYFLILKYNTEEFRGMPGDRFLATLRADRAGLQAIMNIVAKIKVRADKLLTPIGAT